MENASAIFYSENSVSGKAEVEDLLAHEIAHQWFGNMVTEKHFSHLWLSEGFATYLTNVYLQAVHGDEIFHERLKNERTQVIEFARHHQNTPVVDTLSAYMDLLNANSYQKGGWVLHMLREEVGDKIFKEIVSAFYGHYKGRNVDTRDFEEVAEKISGKELTWFFDQWLYRAGIPELEFFTRIAEGEFTFIVKQNEKPFRFHLDLLLVEEDGGVIRKRFEVNEFEHEFKVPFKGSNLKFIIDPDIKLLYDGKE